MAIIVDQLNRAELTVPAAYVDDARRACMDELRESADRVIEDGSSELRGSMLILKRDQELLEQLVDAEGDTRLIAVQDHISRPLEEMLEQMIRRTVRQLEEECVYGPLPTNRMLDLVAELEWATSEAVRLCPAHDTRAAS